MKFKTLIIKGCKTCKQVNIALARDNESGNDYIELTAWHSHEQDGDYYQIENIESQDRDLLIQIIESFTESMALTWANSFTL